MRAAGTLPLCVVNDSTITYVLAQQWGHPWTAIA